MADQASSSIVVTASRSAVLAVIADFDAYPQWVSSVKQVEIVEQGDDGYARRVRFVLEAGPIKDDYVLAYDWHGDDGVSWHLVSGQMQRSQQGSYTLREQAAATEVTYKLSVDLSIPMLGLLKRKAEKFILDSALKDLKKRVEQ